MRPDTHVRVTVAHGEVAREEVIKVHQTVQQFKATLHGWFGVPAQNMKLYYCDKVIISDSPCLCISPLAIVLAIRATKLLLVPCNEVLTQPPIL